MHIPTSDLERCARLHDPAALHAFSRLLPPKARVLDAGCGPGLDLAWFLNQGFDAEGIESAPDLAAIAERTGAAVSVRDLRMLSLKKEYFDGIWCNQALAALTIEECQRVLASFLSALKPGTGLLFVSFLESRFAWNAFLSLLRQTAFLPISEASRELENQRWTAILARRC